MSVGGRAPASSAISRVLSVESESITMTSATNSRAERITGLMRFSSLYVRMKQLTGIRDIVLLLAFVCSLVNAS